MKKALYILLLAVELVGGFILLTLVTSVAGWTYFGVDAGEAEEGGRRQGQAQEQDRSGTGHAAARRCWAGRSWLVHLGNVFRRPDLRKEFLWKKEPLSSL